MSLLLIGNYTAISGITYLITIKKNNKQVIYLKLVFKQNIDIYPSKVLVKKTFHFIVNGVRNWDNEGVVFLT